MGVLEFIKKVEGGRIVIDVPAELDGKEIVVQLREKEESRNSLFKRMNAQERLSYVNQFCGTAKYPDFKVDKIDVYEQ